MTEKMAEDGSPGCSGSMAAPEVEARRAVTLEELYAGLLTYVDRDLDPNKRLSRSAIGMLRQKVMELAFAQVSIVGENRALREECTKLKKDNKAMSLELGLIKASNSDITNVTTQQITFAEATKKNNSSKVQNTIQKVKNTPKTTLFITSKSGEQASKVRETFTKTIDPTKEKIRVRSMRTAGKVLIVETCGEEDARKITANKKLEQELKCEPPKKRRPLLIIYDVPTAKKEEEVLECIYEQNLTEHCNKKDFGDMLRVRFRAGPKGGSTTRYVVEVDPNLRKTILNQGRLYVGFKSLNVRDYVVVPTCNRCQDLGHIAKQCHEKEEVCAHCGKEGHRKAECPGKERPRTCIPCTRKGKQCSKEKGQCPTYRMMVERLIEKTDYGN